MARIGAGFGQLCLEGLDALGLVLGAEAGHGFFERLEGEVLGAEGFEPALGVIEVGAQVVNLVMERVVLLGEQADVLDALLGDGVEAGAEVVAFALKRCHILEALKRDLNGFGDVERVVRHKLFGEGLANLGDPLEIVEEVTPGLDDVADLAGKIAQHDPALVADRLADVGDHAQEGEFFPPGFGEW